MDEDFYISLIYQQLDGAISDSEQQQLDSWLEQDAENQALFDDLAMVYSASEDYLSEEIEAVDVDAAFEQQMKLIKKEQPKTAKIVSINREKKPTRTFRVYRFASIAAVFAALIIAGIWLMDIGTAPRLLSVVAEEDDHFIALSDGSVITLQKGAEIKYWNKFPKDKRLVELVNGKATFEITKGLGTFQVNAPKGVVTVLGTVFDLDANDSELKLNVTEGKVNIRGRSTYGQEAQTMDVIAGESVVLSTSTIHKTKFDQTGNLNYFEFKNTNITNVLAALEKHFSIELNANSSINKCQLTVIFDNKKLNTILKTIDKLLNTNSQLQADGSYIIKGGSCE